MWWFFKFFFLMWDIRYAILCSLSYQTFLFLYGGHRRDTRNIFIHQFLWLAYLYADWFTAIALSILLGNVPIPETSELSHLWAPFLLLHLGGPDTITSYYLEDNEMWLRHLLKLGIQVYAASYLSYRSWTASMDSLLPVLMYVPAIIKYGERIWILSSASMERLRSSMLGAPNPGPNYVKFMDEYGSREEDGFRVGRRFREEKGEESPPRPQIIKEDDQSYDNNNDGEDDDVEIFVEAHKFFDKFKRLFVGLILGVDDWEESKLFFQRISFQKAFKLVDIELGFMFEVLHTKSTFVSSKIGCILRSITLSLTTFVFVMFLINFDKQRYPNNDVIITYLLFSEAIILDFCGAISILFFSDSALLWLREQGLAAVWAKYLLSRYCRCRRTRWCNSVGQFDLLNVSLIIGGIMRYDKPFMKLDKFHLLRLLKSLDYAAYAKVPLELKEVIFQQLCRKSEMATNFKEAKRICTFRGSEVLLREGLHLYDLLGWSIDDVEFDQSILIWHIATDLCCHHYHSCSDTFESSFESDDDDDSQPLRNASKFLSDYMLFLLVFSPFMLPQRIGFIRYQDTEAEAVEFFKEKRSNPDNLSSFGKILNPPQLFDLLLEVNTDIPPSVVKGPKSKSVLFDACKLANQLLSITDINQRWRTVSYVWVEMLSYAAVQCKAPNHAQQLGQGGELLTHVWLLMAHLGITEQIEMPTSFMREKLIFI